MPPRPPPPRSKGCFLSFWTYHASIFIKNILEWHGLNPVIFGRSQINIFTHFFMNIKTVCLFYGVNRNLTTLFSSLLSLHPNCQVLNHSSKVILADKKNFLKIRTQENLQKFIDFAIKASKKNIKGVGGSITSSHAFTKSFSSSEISQRYQTRFGDTQVKGQINSLVWKDATHMTAYLEDNKISALQVAADYPEVRFILPIRNLVDCILSNITKHQGDWGANSHQETAEVIVRRTQEFLDMEKQCPHQFMHFFQDEIDEDFINRLAAFLDLNATPEWKRDFLDCYKLKPSDGATIELKNTYGDMIKKYLSNSPYIKKFEAFAEQIPTVASVGVVAFIAISKITQDFYYEQLLA